MSSANRGIHNRGTHCHSKIMYRPYYTMPCFTRIFYSRVFPRVFPRIFSRVYPQTLLFSFILKVERHNDIPKNTSFLYLFDDTSYNYVLQESLQGQDVKDNTFQFVFSIIDILGPAMSKIFHPQTSTSTYSMIHTVSYYIL